MLFKRTALLLTNEVRGGRNQDYAQNLWRLKLGIRELLRSSEKCWVLRIYIFYLGMDNIALQMVNKSGEEDL